MDENEVNSALPEVSRRGVLAAGALGVASLVLPGRCRPRRRHIGADVCLCRLVHQGPARRRQQ